MKNFVKLKKKPKQMESKNSKLKKRRKIKCLSHSLLKKRKNLRERMNLLISKAKVLSLAFLSHKIKSNKNKGRRKKKNRVVKIIKADSHYC